MPSQIKIDWLFSFMLILEEGMTEGLFKDLTGGGGRTGGRDSRLCLILKLSTQISLQYEKIKQLEQAWEQTEMKIQQLVAEVKSQSILVAKISQKYLPEVPNDHNPRVNAIEAAERSAIT